MEIDLSIIARDPFLGPQLARGRAGQGGFVPQPLAFTGGAAGASSRTRPMSADLGVNLVTARADAPGTMPAVMHPEWYAMARMLKMSAASLLPYRTIDLNPTDDPLSNAELARDMVGLLGVEDMPKADHPGDRLVSIQFVPDVDDPLRRPHARLAVWQHHGCDIVPKIDDPAAKTATTPRPAPAVVDTLEYDMN